MANIGFYLDKPSNDNETVIFLRIIIDGKRTKISTGEKIHPKFWNVDKQESRRNTTGSAELNNLIKSMKSSFEAIIRDAKSSNIEITSQYLKDNFDRKYKKGKQDKVSFYEHYENFIELSKTTKKPGVIKAYRTTLNKIKEFESVNKYKITFASIDKSFYDKFLGFLINKNKYLNNTAGNYIKHIKTFMNFCYQRKIHDNDEFKNFKVMKEESQAIYLTEDELQKIENLDLSFNDRLNNIRNVFLLQCYTGLRYSDIIKLTKEDIKNDFIAIRTVKTKDEINIPISPVARKILDKYDGLNIKFVTNQKMNSYIKELGIRAGIDEPIKEILYRGSERIEKILPKYEMLATHTARRTFITLSLEKGMRPEVVMKITGHKDYKSFKKYIKLTDVVAKEELNRYWK